MAKPFWSYYADLGAPPGYVVPVRDQKSARDPVNYRRWRRRSHLHRRRDASRLIETLEGTPVIEAMAEAFDSGAVIVGISAGAMILGNGGLVRTRSGGKILPGWAGCPIRSLCRITRRIERRRWRGRVAALP